MKKYKYYLIVVFIIMITPILIKTFKTKHNVNYKVNKYAINEKFYKDGKNHIYELIIKKDNKIFSYVLNKNMKKTSKIISKIKEYKDGDLTCIMPSYKIKNKKELLCFRDDMQISNYYLKDDENYNNILKQANINIEEEKDEKITKYKKIEVYNNILDGENYYIWNYNGVIVSNNKDINYYKFIDHDLYDNVMAIATRRYYVLFDNSSVNGINKIYYYDSKRKKVSSFEIEDTLSKDSYINGYFKDLVYVTDKRNKLQYEINIKKGEATIVGNEEKLYTKIVNGNKIMFNKSDYFMENQIFNYIDNISMKEIPIEKYYYLNNTAYYTYDNYFYRILDGGNKELLFEMSDIDDWYVVDRNILVLKEGVLYAYNENGLNKIIFSNELKYNHNNIYKLGK